MKRKQVKTRAAEAPADAQRTVKNWETVAAFLRDLAVQVAIVPSLSADVVKSCTIVYSFLENRAQAVRQQFPDSFETAPAPVKAKKKR